MDHAKYIGRIGALAVALGIGAAVSTPPGWAWADETTAAPHSASGAAGASTVDAGPGRGGRSGQSGSPSLRDKRTDRRDSNRAGTSPDDGDAAPAEDGEAASGVVVSGGADEPADTGEEPASPATADSDATGRSTDAPVAADSAGTRAPRAPAERRHRWSTVDNRGKTDDRQTEVGERTPTRAARAAADETPSASPVAAPATFTRIAEPAAGSHSPENLPTVSVVAAEPVAQAPARNPIGTLLSIPATLFVSAVNGVVNFFEPIVGPGGPLENSLLWGVMAWTRRQLNHTLANRGPEIGQDPISVTVGEGSENNPIGVLPAIDADGDPTVYTVAPDDAPGHGSVAVDGNTVTYTPDPGFTGTDSFTLVATDAGKGLQLYRFGDSRTDTATVVVTVEAGQTNDPPVANPDSATVAQGGTVTVDVVGNDTDSDGTVNPATVVIVGPPAHGTATANADGTVTYVSDGADVTSDSFTYTINDDSGSVSSPAAVTITVTAVANQSPTAVNDTYVVISGQVLNQPPSGVLANDSDPDDAALTAELVTGTPNGTLTLHADGSFSYAASATYVGQDSFTYRAVDAAGNRSEPATVNIFVTAPQVNQQPTAYPDYYSVASGQTLIVPARGLLANDIDPDYDVLSVVPGTNPTKGVLTLNTDGSFSYSSNAGSAGTDRFTYYASDGQLRSNATSVTITIIS